MRKVTDLDKLSAAGTPPSSSDLNVRNPHRAVLLSDESAAETHNSNSAEGYVQTRILLSLAALGRSMAGQFDPKQFLGPFSAEIQDLIPHDLLAIRVLNPDGETFSILAEHDPLGLLHRESHYTPAFTAHERYRIAEWPAGASLAGDPVLVEDLPADRRFAGGSLPARELQEAGLRSSLAVPLKSDGNVVGALCASSLVPRAYTDAHLAAALRVADLVGPFIKSVVQFQQERRRRLRSQALTALPLEASGGVSLQDCFCRISAAVRPILDYDLMGMELFCTNGRNLEVQMEVGLNADRQPYLVPVEQCSFCKRVEAGESVLLAPSQCERVSDCPRNLRLNGAGVQSCVIVPLPYREPIGGVLYFGTRKAHWYDKFDEEIAHGIAVYVTVPVQNHRLAVKRRQLETLHKELSGLYEFSQIIGRSATLQEALSLARKVAPRETTVLITGESGTGKELVAHGIHHASPRAEGPFVTVNCATLPDTLLESELFGHERGAFTGADRQKPGRFELAEGGTVFLDEIGELPLRLQAKLLRVLETREFERLGGTKVLHADVRVVAATNRDLEEAVESKEFREDLYYRLNVFRLQLPPLRERGEDVLLLADHFTRKLGAHMSKAEMGISKDAREFLLSYRWPGNVRELQNAVERALIVSEDGFLRAAHLGIVPRKEAPPPVPEEEKQAGGALSHGSFAQMEKDLVLEALRKAEGNKSKAAELLGFTRAQLYTRLKRFGLT